MKTSNDLIQQAATMAHACALKAYAPYSHFHVGCVLIGENESHYAGCNIENASFSLTLCAESSAISHMITDGCARFQAAILVAEAASCPPCGACRQRLSEHAMPDARVYFFQPSDLTHPASTWLLRDLLPDAFALHQPS